jgi:hypothetical protein
VALRTCGIARAYYTQDRERLKQFAQVLTTGIMERKEDKAAVLLRNWLLNMEARSVRAQAEVIRAKGERALYGFLHNEIIRGLSAATEELFPLPEEQVPGSKLPKVRQ